MQAGVVGINTLRVYNPHKQLLDQDPNSDFAWRWVPELASFTSGEIAGYKTNSIGDYVQLIADIDTNSKVIKDQLYAIRKSAKGKGSAEKVLHLHGSRSSRNKRNAKVRSLKRRMSEGKSDKFGSQMSFDW